MEKEQGENRIRVKIFLNHQTRELRSNMTDNAFCGGHSITVVNKYIMCVICNVICNVSYYL